MMHITEDTPPDMLAGAMDLTVHLPSGRAVKMSIERSTPMMDLLVQITTANHLQHSGHIIQALAMAPSSSQSDKVLPYKPNTPIGALDTQHIKVIPKGRSLPVQKNAAPGKQPFESTFRLQVHLPRNQLYVIRVSQHVHLEDIMKKVCSEKNLDLHKYELRHPGNLDEVLDPKLTLSDYQITEIYVVSKGTVGLTQAFSASDIMALRKEEERKQFQARTGGGVFNLIFKRGKTSVGSGSLSSENRSISPSHSDDSRSVTPPTIQQQILPPIMQEQTQVDKPKPPQRKRRPAPKPPQNTESRKTSSEKPPSQVSNTSESNNSDVQQKRTDSGLTICHSRNSSDSSGYHEPSVLSDHCNASLPRRPKSALISEVVNEEAQIIENSRKVDNLSKMAVHSKSMSSLVAPGRKKKAAPPPPVLKSANSVTNLEKPSPVVASPTPVEKPESVVTTQTQSTPRGSISSSNFVSISPTSLPDANTKTNSEEAKKISEVNSRLKEKDFTESSHSSPKETKGIDVIDMPKSNKEVIVEQRPSVSKTAERVNDVKPLTIEVETKDVNELEADWQYQLPSPPTAFRDASPTNMTEVTNYDTITLEGFKTESVVTDPALFEKLKLVKDSQSDNETISELNSVVSEDDKPIFSKLTLENLEKRKSLVYNRELSTSLKVAQDNSPTSNFNINSMESVSSIRSNVVNELEQVIQIGNSAKSKGLSRHNSQAQEKVLKSAVDSNLPNFKITTYDPKQKINIFEDDSVRSNVENSSKRNSIADFKSNVPEIKQNGNTENQVLLKNSYVGRSMENISYRKGSLGNQSDDEVFKKPSEFIKHRAATKINIQSRTQGESFSNNMSRSESFSSNKNVDGWKPTKPVKRSKSQVALNRNQEDAVSYVESQGSLSKSNSLFDVSGLQSLEVMRLIQNKLNTPNNSTEELDNGSKIQNGKKESESVEPPRSNSPPPKTEAKSVNYKTFEYRGPPAINLSTWSERPKVQVNLKEDTDYKFNSNIINSKQTVNKFKDQPKTNVEIRNISNSTTHIKSQQSSFDTTDCSGVNIQINHIERDPSNSNVSIKINGTEPISSQKSGNVLIKIGSNGSQPVQPSDNDFSTRFINHTTAAGYRKPLGNINKIEKAPRPHSIAFDSNFDISRVPIVRAVELKKPFRDASQNYLTSVTQINSINNDYKNINTVEHKNVFRNSNKLNGEADLIYNSNNKSKDGYSNVEPDYQVNALKTFNKNSSVYVSNETINKPVIRVKSFAQPRAAPVVMGFRATETTESAIKKSWNTPNSYSTLPSKPAVNTQREPSKTDTTYTTNSNVPFAQVTLKRAESNKLTPSSNGNLFANVVLRSTAQVRSNNNRFSTGSLMNNVDLNVHRNVQPKYTCPVPPPPPQIPKVTSVTKKSQSNFESDTDSRAELLNAIRSFGGKKGLKPAKV